MRHQQEVSQILSTTYEEVFNVIICLCDPATQYIKHTKKNNKRHQWG